MGYYADAIYRALKLIITIDSEVLNVVTTSLKISISSTLIASIISVPLAILIARKKFKSKKFVNIILNTLLSLPTVVVGIFVYSLISRRGVLGELELLFTPIGIIVGQVILITPLITALIRNVIFSLDEKLYKTALSMGASRSQKFKLLILEARYGIIGAIIAGFGRVLGEIGVSMMLGGNIKGVTRTITTAMSLETNKGRFAFALALGIILLTLSFLINFLTYFLQEGKDYARR
ncbi:ABC-type tungstate transport system, permease protein [Halanaerobium saccharolyticum subsp. saccharolyticum DSM 6643]|uniref:ABC-type tungstate transport system, permease protein n=1 Tax=Halanaerobium saccharolyticum subsp. saccharolyticum DSM 6643 TaxID=1293054 RepID=M5EFA5_9FIRM|nr:ABC transporter permease [Halanaerobium saccharolyticum]CCU79823.1 ABC-type tungstate transport system, permease protein [Halanaerobium saccharolyticum subsp. saccharolyticum DSM 6643]